MRTREWQVGDYVTMRTGWSSHSYVIGHITAINGDQVTIRSGIGSKITRPRGNVKPVGRVI